MFVLQSIVVGLAAAFLVVLFRPDLLPTIGGNARFVASYADAVDVSAPSVASIYTKRLVEYSSTADERPRFRIESSAASAVVIDPTGYLVTNFHVVDAVAEINVQFNDGRITEPEIVGVDAETDLALLRVEIGEIPAIPLGSSTQLRVGDVVMAIGNPYGLAKTVTQGIVSATGRGSLDLTTFENFIQTDAAINEGNSGGPVFNETGELVGIAFQALEGAENTGHIIPPPVIEHFVSGVAKFGPDKYQGFPADGIKTQQLTNTTLRKYLGVGDDIRGVMVNTVYFANTCDGVLKKNDILTSVAGKPVANNGTVAFGRYGRVDLSIIFTLQHVGSSIEMDIIRDGKTMAVQAIAKPFSRLVPLSEHDVKPRYFIYCGLVFQPLSYDYFDAIDGGSPVLTAAFYAGQQKADQLELVVLSHTLSDKVNIGYERITDAPIKSVNGKKIRDLADLVQKIESSTEPYLRICTAEDQDVIVVPSPTNAESTEANKRILNRYKVSNDRCLEGGPSVAE